jgi:hypothetical protein
VTNDIDVSTALYAPTSSPIGFSASGAAHVAFKGILNGASFNVGSRDILGISISSQLGSLPGISGTHHQGAGLFHTVENAEFRGLSLFGQVSALPTSTIDMVRPNWIEAAGGLAAYSTGTLVLTFVSNETSVSSANQAGGLVGLTSFDSQMSLAESRNSGTITGEASGGFVGITRGGLTVQDSFNQGDVFGGNNPLIESAGGFVGIAGSSSADVAINDSTNAGQITGRNAGGVIGYAHGGDLTLSGVINEGQVGGNAGGAGGGLVGTAVHQNGQSVNLWIISSENKGTVSPVVNVPAGGLVGKIEAGHSPTLTIESSTNSGIISASNFVGGFVGMNYAETQISLSSNVGDVRGQESVGGLMGFWADATLSITDTQNSGAVEAGGKYVGGFVGHATNGSVTIERARNSEDVFGQEEVGGFVGRASNGAGILAMDILNLGDVVANDRHAGGLVGMSDAVTFSRVANLGALIQAGNNYSGGLTGQTTGTFSLQQGFNHAVISASNAVVGGLAGQITSMVNLTDVYNIGAVSQVSSHDGLVGLRGSVGTVSAYTTVASALVSTSTQAELRLASTFDGWDFDNVWGFGECNEYGGFPLLRSLNLVTTYYDVSCGVATSVPTPQTPSSAGGSGGATYQGPVLDPITNSAVIAQQFVLTGSRLSTVSKIEIGGVEQAIVQASATSITISISEETEVGVSDLVITSDFGLLTVQDAIRVLPARTVVESTHPLVGKTKNLSRTPSIYTQWFQSNLQGSGLTRVVCTVAVSEDASRSSRIDQRKFAKAVCEEAARALENPSVWFQTRVTKHSSQVNRLFITFKG